MEWCAKARRADEPLTLRVAARGLGEEAPSLLRDLNGATRVQNRYLHDRTLERHLGFG